MRSPAGSLVFEIDLNQPGQGDHQYKVEVDAATGKIIALSVEQWQIGREHNEDLNKTNQSHNMKQGGGAAGFGSGVDWGSENVDIA